MKRFLILVLYLYFSCPGIVLGQDKNHWERYQSRTLLDVITLHRDSDEFRELQSKKKAMLLTGDDFASQVRLTYMGEERPISAGTRRLLEAWRKSFFKNNSPPPDEFKTQVLFKEGSQKYWLVAQNVLVAALPTELKEGDAINAYVIWIGAIKTKKNWEWLFALNEFVPCPDPKQSCSLEH